jgi:hypothetical protein
MRRVVRGIWVPVVAGLVLFLVNNILLARVVTRLPGGSAVAVTDMVTIGLVVSATKRFGSVTLIYATYGLLAFLGHLGVDGQAHLLRLPALLGAAAVFDSVGAVGRYRWPALATGATFFVVCVFLLRRSSYDPLSVLAALALAYLGLALGAAAHGLMARRRAPSLPDVAKQFQ